MCETARLRPFGSLSSWWGKPDLLDTGAPTYQTSSTIVKITESDVDGTFDFTSNVPGHASFSLTPFNGTREVTFDNLAAGTYHVTETVPAGRHRPGQRAVGAGRLQRDGPLPTARSSSPDRQTALDQYNGGEFARAREPPASGDEGEPWRLVAASRPLLAHAGGVISMDGCGKDSSQKLMISASRKIRARCDASVPNSK